MAQMITSIEELDEEEQEQEKKTQAVVGELLSSVAACPVTFFELWLLLRACGCCAELVLAQLITTIEEQEPPKSAMSLSELLSKTGTINTRVLVAVALKLNGASDPIARHSTFPVPDEFVARRQCNVVQQCRRRAQSRWARYLPDICRSRQ